jgi:hypothetical protein
MVIEQPIIHNRFIVKEIFELMKKQGTYKGLFSCPSSLTITTCRNSGPMTDRIIPELEGYEDVSLLESSLQHLGIHTLNRLESSELPWRNTFKFELLNEYFNSVECTGTEYFMCCDAIDVIFRDDPHRVIDIFESFDCDMLFMSTNSTDGYDCMPEVFDIVKTINGDNGRYLNSGVYIGRTSFVREVIRDCMKLAIPHGVTMDDYREYLDSRPKDYPKGSQDQDIFRYLEPHFYPRIKVDYENRMAYR